MQNKNVILKNKISDADLTKIANSLCNKLDSFCNKLDSFKVKKDLKDKVTKDKVKEDLKTYTDQLKTFQEEQQKKDTQIENKNRGQTMETPSAENSQHDSSTTDVSKILTELESIKKYVSVLDENKDNSLIKKFKNLIPSFGNSSSNSNSNSSSGITKEFSTKLTTLENSLQTVINSSRNQTDDIKKLMTISEELRNSNKSLIQKINTPAQNQTPVDILKKLIKRILNLSLQNLNKI